MQFHRSRRERIKPSAQAVSQAGQKQKKGDEGQLSKKKKARKNGDKPGKAKAPFHCELHGDNHTHNTDKCFTLSKRKQNTEAKKSYSKKELNMLVSQQVAKVLKKDKSELAKKSKKKDDDMDAFNYNTKDSSNDEDGSNKSKESNDNSEMESFKAWME